MAFNPSDEATLTLPLIGPARTPRGHGLREGTLDGGRVRLPGYGAVFARLETVAVEPAVFATTTTGATV